MRSALSLVGGLFLTACATVPVPSPGLGRPATAASDELAAPVVRPIAAPIAATGAAPGAASAAANPEPQQDPNAGRPRTKMPNNWRPGDVTLQGFLGASFFELSTDSNTFPVQDEDATFPTIGGGAQWKLAGDRLDFGVEGLLQFAWNGDVAAFVSSGGGGTVAVDINLLVFDLYGGPFVSCMLGGSTRVYAGAGPLMRWGSYDQDGPGVIAGGDGDGFGAGYYARGGIEFEVSRNTMVGFGARWSDCEVDLSGALGDLELSGVDLLVTVTQGF